MLRLEYSVKSVERGVAPGKLGVFRLNLNGAYFGELAVRGAEQGNNTAAAAEFARACIRSFQISGKQVRVGAPVQAAWLLAN